MRCWLRCAHCETKELVQDGTTFGPCPHCGGGPRFAENDAGAPMYVFSIAGHDLTDWSGKSDTVIPLRRRKE